MIELISSWRLLFPRQPPQGRCSLRACPGLPLGAPWPSFPGGIHLAKCFWPQEWKLIQEGSSVWAGAVFLEQVSATCIPRLPWCSGCSSSVREGHWEQGLPSGLPGHTPTHCPVELNKVDKLLTRRKALSPHLQNRSKNGNLLLGCKKWRKTFLSKTQVPDVCHYYYYYYGWSHRLSVPCSCKPSAHENSCSLNVCCPMVPTLTCNFFQSIFTALHSVPEVCTHLIIPY